jgi:sulfur dioxygenase
VLRYSLETHVHADHVTASGVLREHTGARTAVSSAAGVDCADIELRHGDSIRVGDLAIAVRHTPGHTDTCVTYVVEDGDRTLAFTGDALLIRGCGRTDFQQGDSRRLYRSVHEQIFSLDGETVVYPGHDYKGRCCSTVAEEKRHNPRLGMGVQEDTFVELMDQLDLAKPRHIERALPANLACGRVVA